MFYDPVLKDEFDITTADSLRPVWWEGTGGFVEPIWVTAEKQGVISAIHMWPGSESVIHGLQASHVDKFKQIEPLDNKVNRVMSWLDLPDSERPAFIAAYVPNIDVSLDTDWIANVDCWTSLWTWIAGNESIVGRGRCNDWIGHGRS